MAHLQGEPIDILPGEVGLPVHHLAASLVHVTNSYKYFWLLALIDHIREVDSDRVIGLDQLVARMIGRAWYPVRYYRLSLGTQDKLGRAINAVASAENLPDDVATEHCIRAARALYGTRNPLAKPVTELGRFVPYRLLTPWFNQILQGRKDAMKNTLISIATARSFPETLPPLYLFRDAPRGYIEFHPAWHAYFRQHLGLIEQFCLWNLVSYLERANPNVPAISLKLSPPLDRQLVQTRRFMKKFIATEPVRCIYSGNALSGNEFDIDHFLPWRFVSHDQIWNLAPVHPTANRSKGASLPSLNDFFPHFGAVQYRALRATLNGDLRKNLEEYSLLLKAEKEVLAQMSEETFCTRLRDHIEPLSQIASNMGFSSGWRYMR
jgi:hypothetical protein